jgi:hypothetical protein
MKGIKLQDLSLFHRKYRQHHDQLEANDEIVAQRDKNIAHRQTEGCSEIDMKSLKIIFPSTSHAKYEPMFLLEKIAFIYIELVVKRGYKAMTTRPFRNLAR